MNQQEVLNFFLSKQLTRHMCFYGNDAMRLTEFVLQNEKRCNRSVPFAEEILLKMSSNVVSPYIYFNQYFDQTGKKTGSRLHAYSAFFLTL